MPIFMDRHEVKGVTAEKVAEVHQKDLQVQAKYECKGMTYWFDENSGLAFCLIEAPRMQAVIDMHNDAHGLVPNRVIQVDEDAVYSFLGRISDPFKGKRAKNHKVINESGNRTILHLEAKYPNGYFKNLKRDRYSSTVLKLNKLSARIIKDSGGSKVSEDASGIMASFINYRDALDCAQNIQFSIKERKMPVKVSIGISSGSPVSGSGEIFEGTIKTAKILSYTAMPGRIFVSSALRNLLGSPSALTASHTIKTLTPDEEKFLNNLINYAETNWNSYESGIEHCCESLGMSRSRLYRKLISLTNYSPWGFMKEYRLKMALEKMKGREGNISEIAFDTGFNTPSYFTQCFKERFGILPSDYLSRIS